MTRQLCHTREVTFINEDIVGKETAVVTKERIDEQFIIGRQTTETVKGILAHDEAHTRCVLHLLDILKVAHSGEYLQGAVGLQCRTMVVLAEITQGELIGTVETVTQSHAVVVAYLVIYLTDKLL